MESLESLRECYQNPLNALTWSLGKGSIKVPAHNRSHQVIFSILKVKAVHTSEVGEIHPHHYARGGISPASKV
ncbi:hypothetical protein Naga_101992g1 [Nannochloropsis gaditana]|uniref:Uncharacterized protein n=1 Tax=Nannochloropsis gaditana TaxID=72520 RepID=W7TIH7_9STRA|nr:hypothetical protein Naga_101992g1 [Nannochloropsis gaditana]